MQKKAKQYSAEEKTKYLVAIMDWYSRYILSWKVSVTLEHDFCVEALEEEIVVYGET